MDAAEIATQPVLPKDLVFVDLETTGGNPAYHRITEVGIVCVRDGVLIEEWSSLVNPDCEIPPHIEAFTGISNAMVANAPRFADIATVILEKLRDSVFVAHNARFDYGFLRTEFMKIDMRFGAPVLCTVKLSRRLFPEFVRHNLDSVMERHGLSCSARHRALGDARVLRDFWFKLRDELPKERLAAVAQSLLNGPKLPAHLPPGLLEDLPEGSGVYRFFAEDGELLYVGKSLTLRSRILKQLGGETLERPRRQFGRIVHRVDWVETGGELGAMLCEAEWIKTQKPLHNRRLKGQTGSFTLRACARSVGGDYVEMTPVDGLTPEQLAESYGVFNGEKDARKALLDIARAHQLCLKVLSFEDGAGSCVAHQLGQCKGACVGKEAPLLHNLRLRLALSSLKLKAWPFPGRIVVREGGSRRRSRSAAESSFLDHPRGADLHVVDHWAYLGTAHCEEELAALSAKSAAGNFDPDVYRILVRYFTHHPDLDWRALPERRAVDEA